MTASFNPLAEQNPQDKPQTLSNLDADGWANIAGRLGEDTGRQAVSNSLAQAAAVSPDKAAQSQFMARMTSMPVSAADAYPVEARKLLLMSQADALDVVRKTPALAAFLQVQDNANIAHDDLPALHATEEAVRDMAKLRGTPYDFLGDLAGSPYATVQGFGGIAHGLGKAAGIVTSGAAVLLDKPFGGTTLQDEAFKRFVAPFDEEKPTFTLPENAGPITKFAHGIGGLIGSLPYIVLTGGEAAAGTGADSLGAFARGAVEQGAKAMAVPATSAMVNTASDVYANTQDLPKAMTAGVTQWLVSAAQGAAPVSVQGTAAARILSGTAVGMATGEVGRQATNLAMPEGMKSPFDLTDLAISGVTGGVLGGVMGARAVDAVRAPIEQTAKVVADAGKAFAGETALNKAAAAVAESKTAARAGETFNQLVAKMDLGDGFYVPAEKLAEVLDAQGVSAEELDAILPTVGPKLAEQVALKGDVHIPTSDYLTGVANTPLDALLRPHLKVDPDGLAFGEAKKAVEDQVKAFEKVKPEVERTVTEAQAWDKSAQVVKDNFFKQFDASSRYSTSVSHSQAELFKHLYSTLAERIGLTPEQTLQQFPIDVRGSKWADQLAAMAQDRLDQRAYHGSAVRDITKFEEQFAGTGEGNAAYGVGHYFTKAEDAVAEIYRRIAVRNLERRIARDGKEFVVFPSGGHVKMADLRERADPSGRGWAALGSNRSASMAVANAILDVVHPHPANRTGVVDAVRDILKDDGKSEVEKQRAKEWLATYEAAKERYSNAKPTTERRLENQPNWRKKVAVGTTPEDEHSAESAARAAKAKEEVSALEVTLAAASDKLDAARRRDTPLRPLERAHLENDVAYAKTQLEMAKLRAAEAEERALKAAALATKYRKAAEDVKGQVYAAELPENDVLLHWELYGYEQPQHVKDALNASIRPFVGENVDMSSMTGQQIYHGIARVFEQRENYDYTMAMRKASDMLFDAGIPGHTYDGEFVKTKGTGIRNFVIYRGEAVTDITGLYQREGSEPPRAQIEFNGEKIPVLHLFEGADASSSIHEAGHFFLEAYMTVAGSENAPPAVREMMDTFCAWAKVESVEKWNSMTLAEKEDMHERFAKSFEEYLFNGKAPTPATASLFATFRSLLVQLYKSTMAYFNGLNVSPEMRSVFDRMVAADDAIAQAQRARSMFAMLSEKPEGMADAQWKVYQDLGQQRTDDASAELQVRSLRNMRWLSNAKTEKIKELQVQEQVKRREVRVEARRTVMSEPKYMAWSFLTGRMSPESQLKTPSTAVGRVIDPSRDSLLVAVGKLGGISREEAAYHLGVHEDSMTMKGAVFSAPPFRKTGGLTAEAMAERLGEQGYLLPGENGFELNDLAEKLSDELSGSEQFSVHKDYRERRGSDARDIEEVPSGRLDIGDLKAMGLPDEMVKALQARKMTAKEGWQPELVASRFGFESVDAMLDSLAHGLPPKEAVDAETDRRMLERYSDLATPQAVEHAADKAIHNDVAIRFVAAELAAQAKALGGSRALEAAAKQLATETVSDLRVRDLRPDRYAAAASRAAKEANAAYRKVREPDTAQKAAMSAEMNRLTRKPLTEDEADAKSHVIGEAAKAKEVERLMSTGMSEEDATAAAYPVYEKAQGLAYTKLTAPAMSEVEALPLATAAGEKARATAQARIDAKGGKTPFERSVEMKRAQLLNTTLAKFAYDAQVEMLAAVKRLRKIDKEASSGKFGARQSAAIKGLLRKVDLADMTAAQADRATSFGAYIKTALELGVETPVMPALHGVAKRNFLAKISERNADGELVYKSDAEQLQVMADIMDAEPDTPYINLSVAEMRGLLSTVDQLAHVEKNGEKLYSIADGKTLTEVKAALVESAVANAGREATANATAADMVGRAKQGAENFFHKGIKMATRARIADGGVDGPFHDYLIFPANKCSDRATAYKGNFAKELHDILAPALARVSLADQYGLGVRIPGMNGLRLNWQQRMGILLNMGNEANYQRLLGGGIAGRKDFTTLTPEQLNAIVGTLPAADIRLADKIWESVSRLRPEVARIELLFNGKEPEWTVARKITLRSAEGAEVELVGGHYPIKYDPIASAKAQENADKDAKRPLGDVTSVAATTRRSFTKDRADAVNGRPLLLSLNALYGGINEVIHDVCWREWVRDQNKLLGSTSVKTALLEHYGPQFYSEWSSWVDDLAGGQTQKSDAIDYAASFVSKGISFGGLLFNLTNAVQQVGGIGAATSLIGPKWMAMGAEKYATDRLDAVKEMHKLSPFMAHRPRTMFRDLAEVQNKVNGELSPLAWVQRKGFAPMLAMQQYTVDVPTWWGAYYKAIDDGMVRYDAKGNSDMARVVAAADQAVKDSQGGGEKVDQAAWERDPSKAAKLFTAFYSYGGTQYNVAYGNAKMQRTAGKQLAQFMVAIAIPAVATALLKDAITPGESGNWDTLEHAAKSAFVELIKSVAGWVPVGREATAGVMAAVGSDPQGYQGPTGTRMFADMAKFAKQAHQGEFDDAFRKAAINLLGDFVPGVPSAQTNRSITGAKALQEGKTANPFAVAFGYQEPRP